MSPAGVRMFWDFALVTMSLAGLGLVTESTIIDLTHPLSSSALYWPGVPGFNRTKVIAGRNENNVWIEVGAFSTGEHGGTHIDVPRHFNRSGYDLNDLPIELTIADGVMIDVRDEAARNNDYALTPQKEAADWLIKHRNLKMLGLDVPGPDDPRDSAMSLHGLLLSRNIVIMENVMIPNTLPARGFRVHAAPIRIVGGTGTQTRIYAMMYGNMANPGKAVPSLCLLFAGVVSILTDLHLKKLFTLVIVYFSI